MKAPECRICGSRALPGEAFCCSDHAHEWMERRAATCRRLKDAGFTPRAYRPNVWEKGGMMVTLEAVPIEVENPSAVIRAHALGVQLTGPVSCDDPRPEPPIHVPHEPVPEPPPVHVPSTPLS